jgi:hypothetical protein
MGKVNQGFFLLLAMIAAVTVLRLVLPYGLSATKSILPEVYSLQKKDNAEQFLTDILAHNLWHESRGVLEANNVAANSGAGSDQLSADELQARALQEQAASSLMLVGVSRFEGIAVFKSAQGIKRYKSGALLPEGSRLEEVLEYGVRISKSGENEHLYLFGKK